MLTWCLRKLLHRPPISAGQLSIARPRWGWVAVDIYAALGPQIRIYADAIGPHGTGCWHA